MSEQSPSNLYTGLILLSGVDRPGIAESLFSTLSPFAVAVLDIEQVVIRERVILTVLISLHRSHAAAIEADLNQCAAELAVDIAVSYSEGPGDTIERKAGLLHLVALGDPLLPNAIARITSKLAGHGANVERIHCIASSPVTAVEFEVSGVTEAGIRNVLADITSEIGVDIALLPRGQNRLAKKLVVMDVDSTLIQQEVIDLLAAKAGVSEQVVAITASAMRGEMDFEESLRERVALLKGLPESALDEVRQEILLTPGAKRLIRTLQHLGHCVGVVSGGFIEVIEPIIKELGIEFYRANKIGIESGFLTGTIVGPVVDRAAKAQALRDFATQTGVTMEQTVAIGDGANDLDMIAAAGMGIAFDAKPAVRAAADSALTQRHLDSVLYLMGITSEDIDETTL